MSPQRDQEEQHYNRQSRGRIQALDPLPAPAGTPARPPVTVQLRKTAYLGHTWRGHFRARVRARSTLPRVRDRRPRRRYGNLPTRDYLRDIDTGGRGPRG